MSINRLPEMTCRAGKGRWATNIHLNKGEIARFTRPGVRRLSGQITVVTADVIDSRLYETDMKRLEERLALLKHPALATPFALSRGDEIQGFYRGILAAPELIRHLRYLCRPLSLRIGLGTGPAPEKKAGSSWEMTGEAFYRARQALDSLKKDKRPRTSIVCGDGELAAIANGLFELMDAATSRWTGDQWEAVTAYEREGTYVTAGITLGIAFQNVEKRCKAARWPAVRAGEDALRRLGKIIAGSVFTLQPVNGSSSPAGR